MKKYSKFALLVILLITASNLVVAQESDPLALRKIGVGLHVEQLKMHDIVSSQFIPVNKLIFSISPGNGFRLEPSIGFSKSKDEYGDDGYSTISEITGLHFGLGIFGMYQVGPTNIYMGLRTEISNVKDETTYSQTDYNETYLDKMKRFTIGPVLGAEFFFAERFSFGGEVALKNYSTKSEEFYDGNSTNYETKSNFFSTETGLLLRFYF